MNPDNSLKGTEFRGQLYRFFLSLAGIKRQFRKKLAAGGYPDQPDQPPASLHNDFNYQEFTHQGRKIWSISPRENRSRQVVLYLHGGAYVANFNSIHWDLIEELIRNANCSVIAPDYPLAPTDSWQQTYDFMVPLYDQLLQENLAEDLVFMGDSAGGGLALGLAQLLRNQGIALPGKIILLSPWLDITMTNPSIPGLTRKDPLLDLEALITAGKAYARDLDPRDYRVSPLYGDFQGLPRIALFIGTCELLLPDARKFEEMMSERGFPLNYYEYPHMFHAWVAITRLPEACQAIEQITGLLRDAGGPH